MKQASDPSEFFGWDDLANSISGRRLTASAGRVDTDWDENSVIFQNAGSLSSANDRVIFNFQKPHSSPEDGQMRLHIHWEQDRSDDIVWSCQYRVQKNGEAKTTTWSTAENFISNATNNVFPYVSGTITQITNLCVVELDGSGISATVQFRVARTDSLAGNVSATFIDAHVQNNQSRGSREEFAK